MRIAFISVILALSCFGQVVESVCPSGASACGGSSEIRARGFQTAFPRNPAKGTFLYWGGTTANAGIYSNAIFDYNAGAKTFTKKVDNGATLTTDCPQNGAPFDTWNPTQGHPQGSPWADGNYANMTGMICGGQFPGFTFRYNLSTETMASPLPVAPFSTGNGTFNATFVNEQKFVYAPNVGRSFYCCYSGGGATPKFIEFDGITYTDKTASLNGDTIPGPYTAFGMLYLDGLIYIFGGCEGTSPGNNGDCNGTPRNSLISINPSTYAVTILSTMGTPPTTTFTSWPLIYADTLRTRLCDYSNTDTLTCWTKSTNTWASVALSGDAGIVMPTGSNGSGNMANYDPVHDLAVLIVSRGQSFAPEVSHISFGNGGPLSVSLTIQEALFPGGSTGIARTNEPFTLGVPIEDSTGIENTNTLGLTGATAGQFRILNTWPSGNAKWIQVSGVLASLSAGASATVTLTNSGSGDFGGSDLATDGGSTITVATGTSTFVIRKANYNVINTAAVGATAILASSVAETRGLVLTGPSPVAAYPANVTCTAEGGSACTTIYSSANDGASTCLIEQNGPVMAVVKCDGALKNSGGTTYMKYTARSYFYKNKNYTKVNVELRNADLGTSNTFASAYKGFDGFELRLDPSLTGTLSWTIANNTSTPSTGTVSGSDNIYLYQGQSTYLQWQDWCGFGCVNYTSDLGWRLNVNGSNVTAGANTQFVGGWANIEDSGGVGVEIGVYQLSAYFPKSLEFLSGGDDVRVGIWSARNTSNYYQSWPQHSIHDVYLNFHATALSAGDANNDFLRFQQYLVGRAPIAQYNSSAVLPSPLITEAAENGYYAATATSAIPPLPPSQAEPILDYGTISSNWPLSIFRFYAWGSGGGANQTDFRYSFLTNFLNRGYTGRYLNTAHFCRMQAEQTYPRSDGFQWQDQTGQFDGFTQPTATSANSALTFRNWHDQEHQSTWGCTLYYQMTGDDTIKDYLLDGYTDYFSNTSPLIYPSGLPGGLSGTVSTSGTAVTSTGGNLFTQAMPGSSMWINGAIYPIATFTDTAHLTLAASAGTQTGVQWYQGGGLFNTRAGGHQLLNAAILAPFLDSVGQTTPAANVRTQSDSLFKMQFLGATCMNGYPVNCNIGTVDGGPWSTMGVNRQRGGHWGASGTSGTWCMNPHSYRVNSSFQEAIGIGGILPYARMRGTSWPFYYQAQDLAYGMSQFGLSELYGDDGSGLWMNNGFRFGLAFDVPNNCPGEGPEENYQIIPFGQQTVWNLFAAQYNTLGSIAWQGKFKMALQKLINQGLTISDFGSYQIATLISEINNPGAASLLPIPLDGFTDNGSGSYTLDWTVPNGCQFYRVKYSSLQIVEQIGFDAGNNVFTGNPATTSNWFAATDAAAIPSCGSAGLPQTITVNTGLTGLVPANFSVKAMATGIVPPSGGGGGTISGQVTLSGKVLQ